MPKAEHIMTVAREWISKAENDLKNAANTLKMGEDCPTDTVCFHALSSLIVVLPKDLQNLLTGEEQELLTEYATVTRYPGGYEDCTLRSVQKGLLICIMSREY